MIDVGLNEEGFIPAGSWTLESPLKLPLTAEDFERCLVPEQREEFRLRFATEGKWCGVKIVIRLPFLESAPVRTFRRDKNPFFTTRSYSIWVTMRARCRNEKNASYANYGGRGISVCKEWDESYHVFLADMGHPPSRKHSIDRIDPDGNYCKENCRWADHEQQSENRRTTRKTMFNGELMSYVKIARLHGISPVTFGSRVKRGADLMTAATAPIVERKLTKFGLNGSKK